MKKTYRILLIIFFILILKCITPGDVQAVAFEVYDENGNNKINKITAYKGETTILMVKISYNDVFNFVETDYTAPEGLSVWGQIVEELTGSEAFNGYVEVRLKPETIQEGDYQVEIIIETKTMVDPFYIFTPTADVARKTIQVEVVDRVAEEKRTEFAEFEQKKVEAAGGPTDSNPNAEYKSFDACSGIGAQTWYLARISEIDEINRKSGVS